MAWWKITFVWSCLQYVRYWRTTNDKKICKLLTEHCFNRIAIISLKYFLFSHLTRNTIASLSLFLNCCYMIQYYLLHLILFRSIYWNWTDICYLCVSGNKFEWRIRYTRKLDFFFNFFFIICTTFPRCAGKVAEVFPKLAESWKHSEQWRERESMWRRA